jgi:hypothetical protein
MRSTGPGIRVIGYAVTAAALLLCPEVSHADQGGSSFWFPGQFASLVAVQQTPGWTLAPASPLPGAVPRCVIAGKFQLVLPVCLLLRRYRGTSGHESARSRVHEHTP